MNLTSISAASQRNNSLHLLPWRQQLARRFVFKTLGNLTVGTLRLHEDGRLHEFGVSAGASLVADITVHDPQMYIAVAAGGSIGASEAYIKGHWSTPNLTQVMRLFAANIDALDTMDAAQSLLSRFSRKVFHWLNRNTRHGSRKNIAAHYDLGNDFFSLFLDRRMMYSSAIYPAPDADLETAADFKLKRVCEKLRLSPEDHLLEIGTGWGGMAIYAAQHYGCRVTTTTISKQQYDHAVAQVRAQGLGDRITVLFNDYRDLRGQFTKLVSIEMIEAVGHEHYPQYFATCSQLLTDNGLMLLQAITIPDQRYEQARRAVDFIQRYIFPGGALPSVTAISHNIHRHTDMTIQQLEDIGEHYAQTLHDWRIRFLAQLEAVHSSGFDENFVRMWEFYLCYCEGGFRERSIGTVQILFAKPQYRPGFFA